MSLINTYQSRKTLLAEKLTEMGVTANNNEGLTSLINKITDIEPALSVNNVVMTLELTGNNLTNINTPLTLKATLTGSMDTEDVDLQTGEMVNATIEFYNGETLIGSAITDNIGEAILEYTPQNTGTLILKAIFNGTEIWDSAISNTLNVDVCSLTLTSDKEIIQTEDTVNFTATYLDKNNNPISGESVDFVNVDTGEVIGSTVTNSDGVASVSYYEKDETSLNIRAECGIIQSERYSVEYIYFYFKNDTSKINNANRQGIHGKTATSISSMTVEDDWIVITSTGGNNWGLLSIPELTGINQPCKIRVTRQGGNWGLATYNSNSTARGHAITYENTHSRTIEFWNQSGTTPWGTRNTINYPTADMIIILEMIINQNTVTTNIYSENETLIGTYTYTGDVSINNESNTMKYGFLTNNCSDCKIKDFKVELL